jgi:hypothetical protein
VLTAVLTVLIFGLAPAVLNSHAGVDSPLRGARSSRLWRGRQFIIVFQIALCTLFVVGAIVLLRSVDRLRGVNLGVDRDHVLSLTVDPQLSGYRRTQEIAFAQVLSNRIRELAGVRYVGLAARGIMRGRGLGETVVPAGSRPTKADVLNTSMNGVSPEYFNSLGISLLSGRFLTDSDKPDDKPVNVIVNRAFARHLFGTDDCLGRPFGSAAPEQVALLNSKLSVW